MFDRREMYATFDALEADVGKLARIKNLLEPAEASVTKNTAVDALERIEWLRKVLLESTT
jgi:hypothetical protein